MRGNLVTDFGTFSGTFGGVTLSTPSGTLAGGNIVEGNTVRRGGADDIGIYMAGNNHNNLVLNNVATGNGFYGIRVESSGNRIAGNEVASNGSSGIFVAAFRNLIEGNQVDANGTSGLGFGIFFNTAGAHTYRQNMLRGNATGAVGGVPNTDGGGNIL